MKTYMLYKSYIFFECIFQLFDLKGSAEYKWLSVHKHSKEMETTQSEDINNSFTDLSAHVLPIRSRIEGEKGSKLWIMEDNCNKVFVGFYTKKVKINLIREIRR